MVQATDDSENQAFTLRVLKPEWFSHLAVVSTLGVNVDGSQVVWPVLLGHDAGDVDQLLPDPELEGVQGRGIAGATRPGTAASFGHLRLESSVPKEKTISTKTGSECLSETGWKCLGLSEADRLW